MFAASFLLGLTGSLHCAGMCGPLCFVLLGKNGERNFKGLIWYNIARIFVYGIWGLLVGSIGQVVALTSMFPYFIFGLAWLMFWIAIFSFFKTNLLDRIPYSEAIMQKIRALFKPFFAKRSILGFAGMGVFNALIPCGLMYTALVFSIAYGNIWHSMLFMILFGLGTAPAMISSQYLATFIKEQGWKWWKFLMPFITLSMAVFLMYRSGIIQQHFFPTYPTEMSQCK